jgi:hypothetical protein
MRRIPPYLASAAALGAALAWAGANEAPAPDAPRLADRLLEEYSRIDRLSCHIRREVETPQGKTRFLSRVFWERGGRLHADNSSPLSRTIVSDGTNFFSYIQGDPRGFSRPVAELNEEMTLNLRKVPGTAMEHLLLLKDAAETPLPPEPERPVRASYAAGRIRAELNLDADGRLVRVDLFDASDPDRRTARYDYSRFEEVLPGIWIPRRHEARLAIGGVEITEIVQIDRLDARSPIAPSLFQPDLHFQGVRFEREFGRIYE